MSFQMTSQGNPGSALILKPGLNRVINVADMMTSEGIASYQYVCTLIGESPKQGITVQC